VRFSTVHCHLWGVETLFKNLSADADEAKTLLNFVNFLYNTIPNGEML